MTGCTNYSVTALTVGTRLELGRKPRWRPGHEPEAEAETDTGTGVETVE